MYKITINVLEQPSHEPLIQASVNSGHIRVRKIEGGEGGEGWRKSWKISATKKMRERRHQTAREPKDVNCNVIATFQMPAIIWR